MPFPLIPLAVAGVGAWLIARKRPAGGAAAPQVAPTPAPQQPSPTSNLSPTPSSSAPASSQQAGSGGNLGGAVGGAVAGAAAGAAIDKALGGDANTGTVASIGGAVIGGLALGVGVTAGAIAAVPALLIYAFVWQMKVNADTQDLLAQQKARSQLNDIWAKVASQGFSDDDGTVYPPSTDLLSPAQQHAQAKFEREQVAKYIQIMAKPRGFGVDDAGHLQWHLDRAELIGDNAGGGRFQSFPAGNIYDFHQGTTPLGKSYSTPGGVGLSPEMVEKMTFDGGSGRTYSLDHKKEAKKKGKQSS